MALRPRRNVNGYVQAINIDQEYNINQQNNEYDNDNDNYNYYKKSDQTINTHANMFSPLNTFKITRKKDIYSYLKPIRTIILNLFNGNKNGFSTQSNKLISIFKKILIIIVAVYGIFKILALFLSIFSYLFAFNNYNNTQTDTIKDTNPHLYSKMMKSIHKSIRLYNNNRHIEYDEVYTKITKKYCLKHLTSVNWDNDFSKGLFTLNLKEMYENVISNKLHWNESHYLIGDTSGHILDINDLLPEYKSKTISCGLLDGINEIGKVNNIVKTDKQKSENLKKNKISETHKKKLTLHINDLGKLVSKEFGKTGSCHMVGSFYDNVHKSKALLNLFMLLKSQDTHNRYLFDRDANVFGIESVTKTTNSNKYFYCQPLETALLEKKIDKHLTLKDLSRVIYENFKVKVQL